VPVDGDLVTFGGRRFAGCRLGTAGRRGSQVVSNGRLIVDHRDDTVAARAKRILSSRIRVAIDDPDVGLMLPGLGADFASLEERKFQDWSDAATHAMVELKRKHSVVILVGYSMGGALALHTALEQRPAGLVLLAPFWSFGEGWLRMLWPVVSLLFRRVKPLKYADFSAMDFRLGLQRMFKGIDLENPQIQQALRQITVPLNSIAQVRQLGLSAFERASEIDVPTLVIQGSKDKIVRPVCTARLLNRFPKRVQYQDVNAAHDLVDPVSSAWKEVKDTLLIFAERVGQVIPAHMDSFVTDSVVKEKKC
jgi:carboxylesterase